MKNAFNTFMSILILAVLAAGVYFIVQTVRESAAAAANAAAAPFQGLQEANSSMQTQVSQLLNPTPTIIPDPVTYINEIRAIARLETIQYSIEKVITAEIGQGTFGFAFGDKLLFVAHGIVIAGIDMEKLQPGDMRMDNGVLYVRLPPTEIFIATLDNEKSYVYDRETGLLTKGNINLETLARQSAEDEIRKAALEDGILTQGQTNAENYLLKILHRTWVQDRIVRTLALIIHNKNTEVENQLPCFHLGPYPQQANDLKYHGEQLTGKVTCSTTSLGVRICNFTQYAFGEPI